MYTSIKEGISMSVQSVGPFSNFKTNFNTTKQAASNPQIVQDVAKDVSKNNKKTAAIIGGVAALAILGTGALVAIKRHKVPNEIKTALNNFKETNEAVNALAQNVQKQADEVTEYAQRLFNKVSDLFEKGDEITPDGAVLRKIIVDGDDTYKVMQEFSDDGALVRESRFTNGVLDTIEEGIEELSDGSRKTARRFDFFVDGTLSLYQEGFEKLASGSKRIAKEFDFLEDGTLHWYQEGVKTFTSGLREIARKISFLEDGTPSWYQEGIESSFNDLIKYARNITFDNGKPRLYTEGIEGLADGSPKFAKAITFDNGKPRLYAEGIEGLVDESIKAAKEFELTDKGWKEISK